MVRKLFYITFSTSVLQSSAFLSQIRQNKGASRHFLESMNSDNKRVSLLHATQHLTADELVELGRENFSKYYTFDLDDWQYQAAGAIVSGYNVIACAPTGAGKTVVGECALYHAYSLFNKGIYTTPLKALSNQKYSDLCKLFGSKYVGLLTGDISINKDNARITVMTTEVYRNMAWRASTSMAQNDVSNAIVVLDEFHYMGHPGRGGVWEESVITSPLDTQLVGLSATLSNAEALSSWMQSVTNRTTILINVAQQARPVPLRYLFATKEGMYPLFRDPDAGPGAPKGLLGYRGDGGRLTFDGDKTKPGKGFSSQQQDESSMKIPRGLQVNPMLKAAAERRMQRVNQSLERQKARSRQRNYNDEGSRWDLDSPRSQMYKSPRSLSPREERKERERLLRREMRRSVPSLHGLVSRLDQKNLLPAIFFIFSRSGCDEAARTVYQFMKGPRDPNRLLDDELEQFGETAEAKRKAPTRQRGRKKQGQYIVEDIDGRSFRVGSNYINEDVLTSLFNDDADLMDEDDFDETTPLASTNWDYYAKAGLLEYPEIREVASRISTFNEENPEIAFEDEICEQFMFGVGSHHAGMLPAHKSFVEILFRKQLLKVVFATETLAAGINMPARTTVICSLAKRGDGSSINLLETSNLLQMAGRAGRRGMDTDGTCVIVATPFESHEEAVEILISPIKPIASQFRPSYSLAVNLIARGEGKLDVARQLVSKSFAMWEKRKIEENINSVVHTHGEGVSEILQYSAQERFVNCLVESLQIQVDRRRAKFDITRVQSLLDMLNDRESLKKTSKSFVGANKMLELERTTLEYLQKELDALNDANRHESEILAEMLTEDRIDLLKQIEIQQKRTTTSEKEVKKHPFSTIAGIVNEIMKEDSTEAKLLNSSLKSAREGEGLLHMTSELQPEELSIYAKSAVIMDRKTRKLASKIPDLDTSELLQNADKVILDRDDSWDDMLAITKSLIAYGCLRTENPFDEAIQNLEAEHFSVTQPGIHIGMLGFENSLWCLVALGGAWDIVGASSKLDHFRSAIDALTESDEMEPNEDGTRTLDVVSKSQQEAEQLISLLRQMKPHELAGYVSSLVAENTRSGGPSVVDQFQRLTPIQQRVIQSSLLSMERLMEVQKEFSVDEATRNCILDISNCEVVTAWADGCSWNDALQLSGASPGDLARTLSRVLDAVRQLGNLPFEAFRKGDFDEVSTRRSPRGLHADIRRLCREAAKEINRYPVKDPLAFETPLEELEDELEDDSELRDLNDQ